MIIRPASDSDSDDELPGAASAASAPRHSVFDPLDIGNVSAAGSTARFSWFAACVCVCLLLLVDMAAVFDPSPDVFALLPVLISTLFYGETIILPPTASLLNQIVGLALAGVWIYSRERSLGSGDSTQWFRGARYGPWTVLVLLCMGHIVSCLYVLFALLESNGDRTKFWLGRKRPKYSGAITAPYGRV